MNGIDGLMPKPDDRWATATRRAQGVADLGLGGALKIYYTLYLPAGAIILVAAGTVLEILAFGGEPPDLESSLVIGWSLAAMGAMIGGLLYNAKRITPAAALGKINVLVSLQDEDRKLVSADLREPPKPIQLFISEHLRSPRTNSSKPTNSQLRSLPYQYPPDFRRELRHPTTSGRPVSPSQTRKKLSFTPRFLLSLSTLILNVAPSPRPAQKPRISFSPVNVPPIAA